MKTFVPNRVVLLTNPTKDAVIQFTDPNMMPPGVRQLGYYSAWPSRRQSNGKRYKLYGYGLVSPKWKYKRCS